jgi:hypothetical protein
MTWSSGYVSEIDYTHGYYRELSPLHLGLALMLRDQAPIHGPFRYLELGFGQGLSLNIHAAAVPGEYWGTDFNPNHAANALELAAASGADLHVLDDSFAELARRDDLPDFDVIALHGIWSWISDENRRVIVDIARRKLKVGGTLYISYNATPGWSASMPLRHLLLMHAELASGEAQGILPRIDAALAFGQQLVDAEAMYFKANAIAAERLKGMRNQNRRYLAHEYFNADWHPMPFSDVARYLDEAKVSFAASAHLVDNIDGINLSPEQQKVIGAISHPVLRETVRDYCVNQQFRRDVWVRGRREFTGPRLSQYLGEQRMVLLSPAAEVPLKVFGARGEGQLQADVYRPVIEFLASDGYAPKLLADIPRRCPKVSPLQVMEVLTVLCGGNHAALTQSPEAIALARPRTKKLNDHVIGLTVAGGGESNVLASCVTGLGIGVPPTQQLFLKSLDAGRNSPTVWAEDAWNIYSALGRRLVKDGRRLDAPEENIAELKSQAKDFADNRLPVLKALGVA